MSRNPLIFLILIFLIPLCGCETNSASLSEEAHAKPLTPSRSKVTRSRTDYRPVITTHHQHTPPLKWLVDSGASKTIYFLNNSNENSDFSLGPAQHYRIHGISDSQNKPLQSFSLLSTDTPTFSGIALSSKNVESAHHVNGILGIDSLSQQKATLLISDNLLIWGSRPKT